MSHHSTCLTNVSHHVYNLPFSSVRLKGRRFESKIMSREKCLIPAVVTLKSQGSRNSKRQPCKQHMRYELSCISQKAESDLSVQLLNFSIRRNLFIVSQVSDQPKNNGNKWTNVFLEDDVNTLELSSLLLLFLNCFRLVDFTVHPFFLSRWWPVITPRGALSHQINFDRDGLAATLCCWCFATFRKDVRRLSGFSLTKVAFSDSQNILVVKQSRV